MLTSTAQAQLFFNHRAQAIATILLLGTPAMGVAATIPPSKRQLEADGAIAQAPPPLPRPDFQRPPQQPTEPPLPTLPPPQEILPAPAPPSLPSQTPPPGNVPAEIVIKRFEIKGSTVFSAADLDRITSQYTNKPLDFTQLLQVASEITQLYVKNGYINSGAYIPGNQSFDAQGGTVEIRVVEGKVEDIVVTGTKRLDPNYIKSRIALGTGKVLKIDRLIESLQLLQLDPLIKSIGTELVSGQQPGTSIVQVTVSERPNWQADINIANNRTPSVGEIQVQVGASQNNLTGIGDAIAATVGKSEGSTLFDLNYTVPLNPQNGKLRVQYSSSTSRVIESPFNRLDINSSEQDFGVSYRQPIVQTPDREFAVGVALSKRDVSTGYLESLIGTRIGYPTPGADANGSTRVTAARFFQDYTRKDTQQVFALRSQLSLGLPIFNATNNPSSPDSKFLTWRGQAQYVRALAPNSIFLVKLDTQLADRPLLAIEQIGVGGQDTVRGYRQDLLLADNGIIASAEVRLPIFTPLDSKQVIQVVPFLDLGVGWNQPNNPSTNLTPTIASGGLGLRYQDGNDFSARLDYGIPFTAIDLNKRTGQERGFYFSVNYNRSF